MIKSNKWIPQVFGDPNGDRWEIAVVRESNEHGRKSWGWFDGRKLLISHSGGSCHWPLAPGLGPIMVELANTTAKMLNEKEGVI